MGLVAAFERFLQVVGAGLLCVFIWFFFFWHFAWVPSRPSGAFRLLLVGDPQIEGLGGSSHNYRNGLFNDWYLRFVIWRSVAVLQPTHVVVLGDIFSSQHLWDDEFHARAARYWWSMSGAHHLPVYNLSGNHDIGYGAELSRSAVRRWEQSMGPINGAVRLDDHHMLVWTCGVAMDGAIDEDIAKETWEHIDKWSVKQGTRRDKVVYATHVPLYKPAGSCVGDTPMIQRMGGNEHAPPIEQTLVSEKKTKEVLDALSPVAIVSGHDHEGCDYQHAPNVWEHTVRAVQAGMWGCTAVLQPLDDESSYYFKTICLMHNTPFIVSWITLLVWTIITSSYVAAKKITRRCQQQHQKVKPS